MAETLAKGVEGYFNNNPPDGTYIAWRQQNGAAREHIIARGDTLSGIARRYDVTVRDLLQVNGLNDHTIRVGQTRSEEHTSELQSRGQLVCRLLLEKKKKKTN